MTDTPNLGLTPLAPTESMRNASLPKINDMMDKVDAAFTSRDRAFFGRARDGGEGMLRQVPVREARELLGLPSTAIKLEKLTPTLVCSEAGAYSGGSTMHWKDSGDVRRMTKAFYQSRFSKMARARIDTYVEMYVLGWGNWYFRPSWAGTEGYPTALYTGIQQRYWWDNVPTADQPNFEDFDFIEADLEACDARGQYCWLGLPHWRDDYELMTDLFRVNVVGDADPMRGGLTLAQRTSAAIEFIQRIAQELYTRYGHHKSLVGFKFSQETQHVPSGNALYQGCMSGGSGAYPKLNTYQAIRTATHPDGLMIMITPSRLIESYGSGPTLIDITDDTYAQAWIDSGADVILMQNNAGNGMDYVNNDFTHIRAVEYSYALADNFQRYSKRFLQGIDRANSYPKLKTRRIKAWGLPEIWTMGKTPSGTLTIGAGYNTVGASVTFSCVGGFSEAQVGTVIAAISGSNTGRATVTDISGAPSSVVATINRAFPSNSIVSTLWSIYNGYGNAYPMSASQYNSEIPHSLVLYEKTGLYCWNYMADPADTLQPPQNWATLTDWRTRAQNLYNRLISFSDEAIAKWQEFNPPILVSQKVFREGPLTGTAIASTTRTINPAYPNTFFEIAHEVNWYRGAGAAGDVTFTFKVNGVALSAYGGKSRAGADGAGGTMRLVHDEYPAAGGAFTTQVDIASAVAVSDVRILTVVREFTY